MTDSPQDCDTDTPAVQVVLIESEKHDSHEIHTLLTQVTGTQFVVDTFPSLSAATDKIQSDKADVILIDISPSDADALATLDAALDLSQEVPIILLTTSDDDRQAEMALHAGAQDCLNKQEITCKLLERAIKYALERNVTCKIQKEALEHLRSLNETKSQFVAEASHELRTPLAIIRESVAIVHDQLVGKLNQKQTELLTTSLGNCDRIERLIDNMLDLARIEAGRTVLNRKKSDMADLMTNAETNFATMCSSQSQNLLFEVPDNLPPVHCDEESVQEVLTNLLSNAHKFTPKQGTIRAGCVEEGRFVRVYVKDTGVGIPTEAHKTVFEAFSQVDRKDGPGPKGTGLGLAIAKNLVELNKGLMSLESEPGKGSEFSFTLPVYAEATEYRVLIVDDDARLAKTIARFLRHANLNLDVRQTQNALDALVLAGQFNPHLVILDVHLAELKGEDVLASLKQKMPDNVGKVLAISGDADALQKLSKQGADDYLEKPFTSQDVVRKAVKLLGIERRTPTRRSSSPQDGN